ncbi:hypothetical protein MUN82_02230 [Hymenobacter aerilatus]|uniref:Uncharacterized protein n=1 Tax=Hymenobacter aerilatus TaxID=2932251 RepID=A0A8T9T1Q6_9BACT|nr:hypothetical protein [Hymenobacter aerilatus]UOR05929.1 hypothetical protein MUN82_02230 [Hymenobacter aerilatus]
MNSYREAGYLPDFKVTYRFYTQEEGGRYSPPHQHIRWDFRYDDPAISTGHFMIWPEFVKPTGEVLPAGPVPLHGIADMYIINRDMRAFHYQHIRVGVRGYFMEGKRIAVCEVIEILGLHESP